MCVATENRQKFTKTTYFGGLVWLGSLTVTCQCVCRLHVVAVRLAARVSDGKRIRGIVRETRYTN